MIIFYISLGQQANITLFEPFCLLRTFSRNFNLNKKKSLAKIATIKQVTASNVEEKNNENF